MKTILSECCVDHEKSQFFLRDSRASETRTSVKITPREQGETRRGERKMRDYRQSPSFSPFYWRNPIGCASLIWKAIRTSHSKISRPWEVKSFDFVWSPSFFSLPAASRISRLGWFSRALAFRSLHYPWEKMGTTRSLNATRSLTNLWTEWFM